MNKKIILAAAIFIILLAVLTFAVTNYSELWDKEKYPAGFIVITERGGDIDIILDVEEQVFDVGE